MRVATAFASKSSEEGGFGDVASQGSEELSQKFGEISASVLEQTVNLTPIITLAQGKRVQIRPAKDWYIRKIGDE